MKTTILRVVKDCVTSAATQLGMLATAYVANCIRKAVTKVNAKDGVRRSRKAKPIKNERQ